MGVAEQPLPESRNLPQLSPTATEEENIPIHIDEISRVVLDASVVGL